MCWAWKSVWGALRKLGRKSARRSSSPVSNGRSSGRAKQCGTWTRRVGAATAASAGSGHSWPSSSFSMRWPPRGVPQCWWRCGERFSAAFSVVTGCRCIAATIPAACSCVGRIGSGIFWGLPRMRGVVRRSHLAGTRWPWWPGCFVFGIGFAATCGGSAGESAADQSASAPSEIDALAEEAVRLGRDALGPRQQRSAESGHRALCSLRAIVYLSRSERRRAYQQWGGTGAADGGAMAQDLFRQSQSQWRNRHGPLTHGHPNLQAAAASRVGLPPGSGTLPSPPDCCTLSAPTADLTPELLPSCSPRRFSGFAQEPRETDGKNNDPRRMMVVLGPGLLGGSVGARAGLPGDKRFRGKRSHLEGPFLGGIDFFGQIFLGRT